MSTKSLAGKLIVLTGALGILGKDFAESLASYGADLLLIDKNEESIYKLAHDLSSSYENQFEGLCIDLTQRQQDKLIFEYIDDVFDRPATVLINNAASKSSSLENFFTVDEEFSIDTWREVMCVNVEAIFYLSVEFAKRLLPIDEKGSIINISSIYGHMAPDQRIYEDSYYLNQRIRSPAVYSVSKSAVLGLTRHLATLWGAKGIRVNSVAPGGIYSGQNDVFEQKYTNRVPLNRMAKSSDLLGVVELLASDRSDYITGQNWLVDGGLSTW